MKDNKCSESNRISEESVKRESKGNEAKEASQQESWAESNLKSVFYDLVLWFFNFIIHTFFRDIKSRGIFNLPKQGPVVFVIAPHANQFVDPLVVMSKVKEYSGRRISFLIASKSYRRRYIGALSKLTSPIPVERAQDLLKTASGRIWIENLKEEGLIVKGEGTKFTKECMVKGLIGFSSGNAQIASIESDTQLTLKRPFKINIERPTEHDKQLITKLTEGSDYKTAPHIDNNVVFQHVFDHLNSGNVLGIFPEGGSHDRTDLLPLKPGVAIMALGAAAQSSDPNVEIKVIPVGLNYFHPHKFRSRVVIEFGEPIVVDKKLGESYKENSRDAVSKLLSDITMGLKEVTVTCDDYDTLMALQAARRLYTSSKRESIPLPLVVEMNRRLIKGYEKYSDDESVKELKRMVTDYNKQLMRMGLHDHQVPGLTSSNKFKAFLMFSQRLFKVFLFFGLSLPGVFLFSPVFITGRRISRKKAKEALQGSQVKIAGKDVLSTWKIMVALFLAPALYILYSIIGTVLIVKSHVLSPSFPIIFVFLICYGWSVLTTYASLRIGEIGVDYYKSLKPLFYSVLSDHKDIIQIEELKEKRKFLAERVKWFCDTYGPDMFDDYNRFYRTYNNINENDYEKPEKKPEEPSHIITLPSIDSYNLDNLADVPIFSSVLDRLNLTSSPPPIVASSVSEEDLIQDEDRVEDSEEDPSQDISILRNRKFNA